MSSSCPACYIPFFWKNLLSVISGSKEKKASKKQKPLKTQATRQRKLETSNYDLKYPVISIFIVF